MRKIVTQKFTRTYTHKIEENSHRIKINGERRRFRQLITRSVDPSLGWAGPGYS